MMKRIGAIPYVLFLPILSLLVFGSIAYFGIYPLLDAASWLVVVAITAAAVLLGIIFAWYDIRSRGLKMFVTMREMGDARNQTKDERK